MKRTAQLWLAFIVCVAAVLAAMGWVSLTVLRLERANREAQENAALEETVRLALWRMDSMLSPLIIEESARPYFEYASFNPPGVTHPEQAVFRAGENILPSPLLSRAPSNVMVYFNGAYDAKKSADLLTSPQVPPADLRRFAVTDHDIARTLDYNFDNLRVLNDRIPPGKLREAFERTLAATEDEPSRVERIPRQRAVALNDPVQGNYQTSDQQQLETQQDLRNTFELAARKGQSDKLQARLKSSKEQWYDSQKKPGLLPVRGQDGSGQAVAAAFVFPPAVVDVSEGIMRPLWIEDFLLLARRVRVNGRTYIQGMWLNWEYIRAELLEGIKDLLPEADLAPSPAGAGRASSRILASLPVRLIPGPPAAAAAVIKSPLQLPLAVAWACVLVAAAAVAILLAGVVSLSERLSAFVSAVTHELRTPLTTFQMYAEMLEAGMVTDPAKQGEYLRTLCGEGQRLGHLVENVLSYSRLERGRAAGHPQALTVAALLEQVRDRLAQRAEQAGMTLVCARHGDAAGREICVDTGMAEQILFNLVDNACKYAADASDRRIHLDAAVRGRRVALSVRDHGPGIAPREAGRMFKPFRKSAQHAAESAPGVGLGLALSRRLARRMGGDLRVRGDVSDGACLDLVLP